MKLSRANLKKAILLATGPVSQPEMTMIKRKKKPLDIEHEREEMKRQGYKFDAKEDKAARKQKIRNALARTRNALITGTAGGMLGGMVLPDGKSGKLGAQIGAAIGGVVGAAQKPRKRTHATADSIAAGGEFRFAAKRSPKDNWRRGGYIAGAVGNPAAIMQGIEEGDRYEKKGVIYRKRDAAKHALPPVVGGIAAGTLAFKGVKKWNASHPLKQASTIKDSIKAAMKRQAVSRAVIGGSAFIGAMAASSLAKKKRDADYRKASKKTHFSAKSDAEDFSRKMQKQQYVTDNLKSYGASGLSGAAAGAAVGGLLLGKRGVKGGAIAGAVGGAALRGAQQKRINKAEDKYLKKKDPTLREALGEVGRATLRQNAVPAVLGVTAIGALVGGKKIHAIAKKAGRNTKAASLKKVRKSSVVKRTRVVPPGKGPILDAATGQPFNYPALPRHREFSAKRERSTSEKFRDVAIGAGALGFGGAAIYASKRAGAAANAVGRSAQKMTPKNVAVAVGIEAEKKAKRAVLSGKTRIANAIKKLKWMAGLRARGFDYTVEQINELTRGGKQIVFLDDPKAPFAIVGKTPENEFAGEWKTIDQREDERNSARRWKRRGQYVAGAGALAAVGAAGREPQLAEAGARRIVEDLKFVRAVKKGGGKASYANMAKQSIQNRPHGSALLAGSALAGAGLTVAGAAKLKEMYAQKKINDRRKKNAKLKEFAHYPASHPAYRPHGDEVWEGDTYQPVRRKAQTPEEHEEVKRDRQALVRGAIKGAAIAALGGYALKDSPGGVAVRKAVNGALTRVKGGKTPAPSNIVSMPSPFKGKVGRKDYGPKDPFAGLSKREREAKAAFMRRKKTRLSSKEKPVEFGKKQQPLDANTREYAGPIKVAIGVQKAVVPVVDPDGNKVYDKHEDPRTGAMTKRMRVRPVEIPVHHGQVIKSIYRQAHTASKWTDRVGNLAKDTSDTVRGIPRVKDAYGRRKKREWEKTWAKRAVTGAAITAGGLAAIKNDKTRGYLAKGYGHLAKLKKAIAVDLGDERRIMELVSRLDGALNQFDNSAPNWDIRHESPSGKSARVYAPESRPRERRKKYWHEKLENERKLWGAGLVGATVVGALGHKKAAKILTKRARSKIPPGTIPFNQKFRDIG